MGTLGTIDWQTVTGAVMTGTHGGSLTTGSLHTFAESYTILRANGEIVKVSRSENPKLFSAIAPSNGVFGVIVEMEMRCVPLQYLAAKMIAIPFEDLPGQFCDIMRNNKYARVIVYPTLNQATVWTATPVESKEAAIAQGATFLEEYTNFRNLEEKEMLMKYMEHSEAGEYDEADVLLKKVMDSQLIRLKHYAGKVSTTCHYKRSTTHEIFIFISSHHNDPLQTHKQHHHVLCKERNHGIPHADMEFGFKFEQAPEILEELMEHFKTHRMPYYNFEMRTTQADDAMLSCCNGRDTTWIDFQGTNCYMQCTFISI